VRRIAWYALFCALGSPSAWAVNLARIPACNGACIDQEALDRVVGAAQVTVVLGQSTAQETTVAVDRWIAKPQPDNDLPALATGPCIPDRKQLRALLREPLTQGDVSFVYPPAVRLALKSGRYSLIVLFGRGPTGKLEPRCARELAINWDRFPLFSKRMTWLTERLTAVEHCVTSGHQTRRSPADQLANWASAEGACVDGLKSGPWRYDHGEGTIESGVYDRGQRTGPWSWRNGTTEETVTYREGRKQGR
jgi:hypothetical protein